MVNYNLRKSNKNQFRSTFALGEAEDKISQGRFYPLLSLSPQHIFVLLNQTNLTYFIIEVKSNRLVYVSRGYEDIWGKSRDYIYQSPNSWLLQIHQEDYGKAHHTINTNLRSNIEFSEEFRIVRQDSSICPVRIHVFPLFDLAECISHHIAIFTDLRPEYRQNLLAEDSVSQYRYFFQISKNAFAITNSHGEFINTNESFGKLTEYSQLELLKSNWKFLIEAGTYREYYAMISPLIKGESSSVVLDNTLKTKSGNLITITNKITIGFNHDNSDYWFYNEIIDNSKEKVSNPLPNKDRSLVSGLPNFSSFKESLLQELERVKSDTNYNFGVILIEIDKLQNIYHNAGLAVTNQIINLIALRLSNNLQANDLVADIERNQFAIILRGTKDIDDPKLIAQRLYQKLKVGYSVQEIQFSISPYLAVISKVDRYKTVERIIRDGNLTLNYLKVNNLPPVTAFELKIREDAANKLRISCALPDAIANNQIVNYYQPLISLETGKIYGFEALARWIHNGKMISPGDFIPLAEQSGKIVELGAYLTEDACNTVKRWQQKFSTFRDLKISINLSPVQFRDRELLTKMLNILHWTELNPHSLKCEITESLFIDDFSQVTSFIKVLSDRGVKFSLDDFGTGYSSLSYLQSLPVHTLKLDRSFVLGIHDQTNQKIVQAIVTLAHVLGMDIIAEGIETDADAEVLKDLGCEYGQGYLFSKPLSAEDAERLLLETHIKNISEFEK